MKLAFLILAAAMNPVFAGDPIQENRTKSFELFSVPPTALVRQQSGAARGDLGLNWNWTPSVSTNLPVTNFVGSSASPPLKLKPGVYKTSPYTLLVLVPGPQHDDGSIAKSGTAGLEKMPVARQGLKFTPYSFAGQ
jgi:hypothetical protein